MDRFTEIQIEIAKLDEKLTHLTEKYNEISEERKKLISDGKPRGIFHIPKGHISQHDFWEYGQLANKCKDIAVDAFRIERKKTKLLTEVINLLCDEGVS